MSNNEPQIEQQPDFDIELDVNLKRAFVEEGIIAQDNADVDYEERFKRDKEW